MMMKSRDWSELLPDVLQLVFKLLSFADFLRAKAVCSAWTCASKSCIPRQDPWLLLPSLEEEDDDKNFCLLFNPEEDQIYRMRGFAKSRCMAISGSWLLLIGPRVNLYLLNLFTRESINLPPVESFQGPVTVERKGDYKFIIKFRPRTLSPVECSADDLLARLFKAVLWVDEKTRDYLVVCMNDFSIITFCRKGDDGWRELPEHGMTSRSVDMVYKSCKLYVYSNRHVIRMWDFSGDSPRQTGHVPRFSFDYALGPSAAWKGDIAVSMSGDLLMVVSVISLDEPINLFYVYKINSNGSAWEYVDSLGDEALILDLRTTVPAKDIKGIKANSIYFSLGLNFPPSSIFAEIYPDIGNFDYKSKRIQPLKQCGSLLGDISNPRWFFPGLGQR